MFCLLMFCNRGTDLEGEVVVQVAIEMSLDEWRALQETSRPKSELNLRKADTEVPSKARVIHESNLREVSTWVSGASWWPRFACHYWLSVKDKVWDPCCSSYGN